MLGEVSTQGRVLDSEEERIHEQMKQAQAKSSLMGQKYTLKEGVCACLRGEQGVVR